MYMEVYTVGRTSFGWYYSSIGTQNSNFKYYNHRISGIQQLCQCKCSSIRVFASYKQIEYKNLLHFASIHEHR